MKINLKIILIYLCILMISQIESKAQTTIYGTDFGTVANVNPAGWTFTGLGMNINNANNPSSGYAGVSGSNCLGEGNSGSSFVNTSGNTVTSSPVGISTATLLINTLTYCNISVSFGIRKSSATYNTNATYVLEWSTDNITYTPISYTEPTAGNWGLVSGAGLTLPAGANNQANLYLRWTFNRTISGSNYKIDDFKVMASIAFKDYKNYNSAALGTYHNINFREAGFSSLYAIANTNGKEFWTVSDRGVNIDDANANPAGCHPSYDKMYAFPNYAPKIHRIRVNGDSVQILQTITMKRPGGTDATGIINPTGLGSTTAEQASTDTVLNCANFSSKTAAKDIWGIDSEGIVVDKDGNFWICEEGGPTIWKLNKNGIVVKRFTPYGNLASVQAEDVAIDTVFKYRKNNRGFESIAITPNGKIYAIIQSPILYPNKLTGEATQVHRILEINPVDNSTRMFAYLNDGIIGVAGPNQIKMLDWKIGDMDAINDNEFLVIEAAAKGTTDIKKIYRINISGATPVNSGLYGGVTLEALVDASGLAANSITPVTKVLFLDLLANGWPSALDKSEGLAIINDSTIALCNDNDYGQACPLADGIGVATTNLSHVIKYTLQGANKISGFQPVAPILAQGQTGISTSQSPYLVPFAPGVNFTSIISATDVIGGYKMCGIPDGLGAFDNGSGTFTLLMNHELNNNVGGVRAHGSIGAFVSKWVINKSDLSVVSGGDLIQNVKLWDKNTSAYLPPINAGNPSVLAAFGRFCSADLPAVSAFYNSASGLGTQERIFMNGEENGNEGRLFGHIATGVNAGTSYELPYLGKFSSENALACPTSGDKTVVVGLDDTTPQGQVYVYVGTKTSTGTEIDKAGLNNGKLYGIAVSGLLMEINASVPTPGTAFTMIDLGTVRDSTGTGINTKSNNLGVTLFLRPEDGAWDPSSPKDFYFNTTNSLTSPSRLWRLRFTDQSNPELGGTITAVLDGTEGQKMLDNMTIDNSGHILLVEDVGSNIHDGKVWQYTIGTDALTEIAYHDSTRFVTGGANFLTIDEESSGIIDAQEVLGVGMFLTVVQAHYAIAGEVVEGGQLLAFNNPTTTTSNPEVALQGNSLNIIDGDITPSATDNTDFGSVPTASTQTQTFSINNAGPGSLTVTRITFSGINANEFTLVSAPSFPLNIASGGSQTIAVQFLPTAIGIRNATINIYNTDFNEATYDVAIQGAGVVPTAIDPSTTVSSNVQVFPNPAKDVVTVAVNLETAERITIRVYDVKGNLAVSPIEKNFSKGKQQVDFNTSGLENGIYFVHITSSSGTAKVKTVVMH